MRKQLFLVMACMAFLFSSSQPFMSDSLRKAKKDSTLHARMREDSIKTEREFGEGEKWDKLFAKLEYPLLKGGKFSGVIPVKDPTEIPDPNQEYKLLFELTANNPDSLAKDINQGLDEVTRVMNLHFASGIPAKKIIPVIVVHGPALAAISNNETYKRKFNMDNPNLKLIQDLEKAGAKFIACGQAMAFFDVKKEELLPEVKVSLTAQTVLSNYQTKGYILYSIEPQK